MWHVPGKLHDASLRCMRRLMHCLLLLPPRPIKELKVLYTIVILIYLVYVTSWRFSFNYHVVYDMKNDHVSRNIDLLNFVGLIVSHAIVVMELLWINRGEEIERQLQHMRHILRVQFGHEVNLGRIRLYCNLLVGSLIVRLFILLGMTIFVNFVTDNLYLLFYCYYSEIVLLIRLSEFSMYSSLILCFYRELIEVSSTLIAELESTDSEMSPVRCILLDRLFTLQHLHGLLWNTTRAIERNFALSLISIMLKLLVNTSMMPYWIYLNVITKKNWANILYCFTDQSCQFMEIVVPCLICNRCEQLQRQLRAIFHTLSTDRRNIYLNLGLFRISWQLGQENCFFSACGMFHINNETMAKFVFGMVSYFFICIQFHKTFLEKFSTEEKFLRSCN